MALEVWGQWQLCVKIKRRGRWWFGWDWSGSLGSLGSLAAPPRLLFLISSHTWFVTTDWINRISVKFNPNYKTSVPNALKESWKQALLLRLCDNMWQDLKIKNDISVNRVSWVLCSANVSLLAFSSICRIQALWRGNYDIYGHGNLFLQNSVAYSVQDPCLACLHICCIRGNKCPSCACGKAHVGLTWCACVEYKL